MSDSISLISDSAFRSEESAVASVKVLNSPIKLDKYYTVACPDYVANGNEEYDMLTKAERIVDLTHGPHSPSQAYRGQAR